MAESTRYHRHVATMKEHLAGQRAAAAEIKDLAAAGLLRYQTPIRDTPVTGEATTQEVAP